MELEEAVLGELNVFNLDVLDYTMSTRFCDTGIDNLDIVEVLMKIEDKMKIDISDELFYDFKLLSMDIEDFVKLIRKNIR